ncbi:hypothetical protein ABZ930_07480 [Streptomyces sp. NPDC046716]|uniref:hypothetical protein n=1 Tax=Streptomyces sp. NPDC046716 TaxID=3157093 RepID=UPI0033CE7B69
MKTRWMVAAGVAAAVTIGGLTAAVAVRQDRQGVHQALVDGSPSLINVLRDEIARLEGIPQGSEQPSKVPMDDRAIDAGNLVLIRAANTLSGDIRDHKLTAKEANSIHMTWGGNGYPVHFAADGSWHIETR